MSKKKKDKRNSSQKKTFKGVVEVTRSGMAFVIVQGLSRDIMVKQKNLNSALDSDEVLVDIIKPARNEGRQEGVITEILKRNKTEFTGTLQVSKNFGFLIPEKGMFMPDIYIPANSLGDAKSGDKAVVKIVAWGEKSRKPVGEIIEILDASNTNDLAMKEILIEAGFPLNFPKEVMEELASIQEDITEEEIRKRKDCRDILTFTIDPVDAKDFDDAISIRPLKNGMYEVGVHIADVSHYVKPGTALDKEAERRATSVYLPDRVLPMLPEKISNELCSLRPHEEKCTFSAIFQMNEKGEVKQHWIGRTVIYSDHRFTYEDVQEIIESGEGQYKNEILLLNKMAQTLRAERFAKGAINFSSQEVRFKLDETGKPIGIVIKESKQAHQLIEELMLLANRTVATYVSKIKVNKQPVPFPYRVHDTPDPEKLKVFAGFAYKFGYRFDLGTPDSIARSFNKMLEMVQGKPEQHVLETLGIRTMAKAAYTVDNIGHYGLGFEDYCHFTSPIRRYPDVLVHRVVAECLANDVHPDKQMEKECRHCSEMERKAMEAERAANKYKQVEYMQQYIGGTFKGVISGVAHFGFWVETVDTKCEGLVSIHNLNKKEDFVFNEAEYALVGTASGRRFRIGEEVEIRVVSANLAKRQLDYELEEELQTNIPGRRQQPSRREQQQQQQQRFQQPNQQHPKKKKKKDKKQYIPQAASKEQNEIQAADVPPIDLPVISESIITPPEVPAALQPVLHTEELQQAPVLEKAPEQAPQEVFMPEPTADMPVPSKKTKAKKATKVPASTTPAATPKEGVKAKPVTVAAPVAKKERTAKVAAKASTTGAKKTATTKVEKVPAKKAAVAKVATPKKAAKTVQKPVAVKKASKAEKPVVKKNTPTKATAKAVKKVTAPSKVAVKKTVAKKAAAPVAKPKKAAATVKPATPKKAAAKKATVKKAAATKVTAKKATPKKAVVTKPAPKKAAAKKAAAKKAVPKKVAKPVKKADTKKTGKKKK
ncbi:ribonuclease R [Chitinophaga sp. Hz27]|uniref:ribonuclease R n=1 Tax=Chitinophaga sp. Hz27 TaxID=3347169 RepID=UPI0035DDE89F